MGYCGCAYEITKIIRKECRPVYFNAVYIGGSQYVAPGSEVHFLLSFQSGDFDFTSNTSVITVKKAGVYKINYEVTLRPNEGLINAAYAVVINGSENPLSFFGEFLDGQPDTDRLQLSGFFIADIPAGATVGLRNKSATTNILDGTGINNQSVNRAAIVLHKI